MKQERSIPLLVVNEAGYIIAMNDEASLRVGESVGRPCWDAVGALDERREPFCRPDCLQVMTESTTQQSSGTAFVRGEEQYLSCTRVGDLVVVRFEEVSSAATDAKSATPAGADAQPASLRGTTTLLSAEQSEILHLVAQGKSASAIAEELGISNSTVRTRLTDLREKFGALSLACGVSALRSS